MRLLPAPDHTVQKLLRAWAKERDPDTWRVLEDAVLESGGDEAYLSELKLSVDQEIRREQLEWAIGEVGNLETEPWLVQPLTLEPSPEVEENEAAYIGFDGEMFYPDGEPRRKWLVLDGAPEYLRDDLRRYDAVRTVYTDGGGFQSDAEPALVDVESDDLWQLVGQGGHGAETECPLKDYDEENREEARDRVCTVNDTYYGEYPNKRCRFCEAELGEEHGYVYIGEGGEYVYARVPPADEEEYDNADREK